MAPEHDRQDERNGLGNEPLQAPPADQLGRKTPPKARHGQRRGDPD